MRGERQPAARSLRLAVVQMKFRPDISRNVAHIVEHVHAAAAAKADAILFPECAVTGYRRDFAGLDAVAVAEGCSAVA
ncbi:MAG: nitrilase-related carbon-nitrogen hydrolase, partial [Chthoniobacteraceae bacterium]